MSRARRDLGFLLSLVLALGALGAVRGEAAASPNSLTMAVVGATGTVVTGPGQFEVGGDTAVNVAVARLSGGNARVVAGPDSATQAVQFPAYVRSGTYPRAVVSVTPTSGDGLSPGTADFEYGAVFRLDATSSGRSIDNGDNLFQRGLYEDAAQFKLQIDRGYPSCRVKGSAGQVFASSTTKVVANQWYTATCSRVGSRVTVQVAPYGSTAGPSSVSVSGSAGSLTFPATQPAAIGGKVTRAGAVVSSATDQFNGAVARVWAHRLPVEPPPNEAPVAHASATCTDLDCTFDATDSSDPDDDPLTYTWDFADGTDPGTGATTTHDYATAAARLVTLTVADDHGHSATDTALATTSEPVVDEPPVARATGTCTGLTCTLSGAGSTDPEGSDLAFTWDFGDGTALGSGATPTHTYAAGGTRTVVLTVTDGHGGTGTGSVVVTPTAPPVVTPISFVAAATTNGNRTSHAVTVPAGVRAGDALVLFLTANTTSPTYTNPAGWTVIQSRNGDGTVVRAYRKVATASDAGSSVRVTSSAFAKSDLTVAAYRSTSRTDPVASSASKVDSSTGAAHVSPALTATGGGQWLVTYWADKSTSTSGWTAPAGQSVRARSFGTAGGHISALLTDSNGPVPVGTTGQKTATANSTSTRGASVSVLLTTSP